MSFVFSEKAIGANQTNKTQPLSTFWLEHLLFVLFFPQSDKIFLSHSDFSIYSGRGQAAAVVRHTSTSICLVHLKLLQGHCPVA